MKNLPTQDWDVVRKVWLKELRKHFPKADVRSRSGQIVPAIVIKFGVRRYEVFPHIFPMLTSRPTQGQSYEVMTNNVRLFPNGNNWSLSDVVRRIKRWNKLKFRSESR